MAFVGEGGLDEARERFILIHLPLPRAEQYYHALLKYAGFRTYPLPENAGIRVEAPENAPDLSPLEDDPELAEALRRFGLEDA